MRTLLSTGMALMVLPTAAWAGQAPGPDEGSIVVTGQRQQYFGDIPAKEIPQSVQVIDNKMLSNLNVTRLDSALDLASGISRQNNFGGLWDSFAIRGFAGDENYPSGFLVNGFNAGRGYAGPRDASNIESIEILKGPNAAIFGRGEPGGTVNLITKKATVGRGSFGSFSPSAGSFNLYRVEGDYNLAISDKIAVRVNGAAEKADSFRDYIHTEKKVITPSVLFKPTDKTTLSYELEYVDQKVPFDRGVVALNGQLGVIPRSRFLGEPGDGPIHIGVLGHQVQLQQDLGGDGWTFLAGFGHRETSFTGYSTEAELASGRQTLFTTGNYLSRQHRYRDYHTADTVARAEISGKLHTGPFTHHVIIGADWDEFDINLLQLRSRPSAYTAGTDPTLAKYNSINIFAPVYGQLPTPTSFVQNSLEKQKSYGIYFQDQIDVTKKLKLRFGGRYDNFHQQIGNRTGAFVPSITDNTRTRFSPSAGVLYDFTQAVGAYFAFGTGFRPNSGLDASSNPFAPETSKSYEAGLRYTAPGNAVNATLAAFTMTKNNILTSDPVNAGFSIAGGSARSQGIEATLDAKLPGDFDVHATYAYTDAHWTSSSLDPNFAQLIQPGAKLINIPKHAANLLVTKGIDLGKSGKVTLGAGVNYVSSRLGETATTFYLPGYTLTRVLANYEPVKNIRLGVDVTNLFNVTWYPSSYSRLWVQPGAPRTVMGRATFTF